MKIHRILALFLILVITGSAMLTACNGSSENEETSSETTTAESVTKNEEISSKNEESSSKTEESSSKSEESSSKSEESTTEIEEETTVIIDVMIGETLEAEPAADFSVAKVFSDYMVVQRGEHIRVWGFAPESENGKKVSGEFKGMFAEALIENGEWCITFGARLDADTTGAEMTIYAGENKTVTFKDVLVGDVYLILGQSNAALALSESVKGGNAVDIDENSIIRLNYLNGGGGTYAEKGTDYVYKDLENTTLWTKTTQAQTLRFSGIGYHFAQEMVARSGNKVPVGLMEVAYGGAPLASFLPNDLAELYDSDYYSAESGKYISMRDTTHFGRYLYNCYLAPASRYAVAGVLWYQGESDNPLNFAQVYGDAFGDFVERLRSTHNVINKEFPVFVVEFPTQYQKPADYSGNETWHYMEVGTIRTFMGLLPTKIDNLYLSASSDLWTDTSFPNSLHPNCKPGQAKRLADIAEFVIFGKGTLDAAMGPIFSSATLSEDKKTITVTFTNVGDGLTTADGGTAVKGIFGFAEKAFGLANPLTPVSAEITAKNQITVTFDEAVKAVVYNYNTTDVYGETLNLCNSAKIPALAFVTPYEDMDLSGFSEDEFVSRKNKKLGLKGVSIDRLISDGTDLFAPASVESGLSSGGNKIEITKGTSSLSCTGWIGFGYPTLAFGYSIDGSDAILKIAPTAPESAVLAAGGEHAVRFSINIDVSELEVGEHTVSFLAYVDANDGVVAKLISFTLVVVEK
ncbi:MAG: hypothetical protein IJV87_02175 [Clostridia bacterium]|nr:hypothetical protein [Clostridia bacterium]